MPPEIQSSTGILSLSFHTDMAVAKDGFSARYNMTHKEVSESKWSCDHFPCTVHIQYTLCMCKGPLLMTKTSSPPLAFHCSSAFGMESGKITDDQITASSSFYDGHWMPRQARLSYNDNAWTPSDDSNREYIQVQCDVEKHVL